MRLHFPSKERIDLTMGPARSYRVLSTLAMLILLGCFSNVKCECPPHHQVAWTQYINKTIPVHTGFLTVKPVGNDVPVTSCKNKCNQIHTGCRAFVYDKSEGECTLFREKAAIEDLSTNYQHSYMEWDCLYKTTFTMPTTPRPTTPRTASTKESSSTRQNSPTTPLFTTFFTTITKVTPKAMDEVEDADKTLLYIIVACSVAVAVIVIAAVLLCIYCRKTKTKKQKQSPAQIQDNSGMNGIGECSIENENSREHPTYFYGIKS